MSKKKETAYNHITPELVDQVKDVIAESVKHNYSVSKVFGTHNAVFQRKDQPQTCSSCLRNRVRDLKRWLAEYEKQFKDLTEPEPEYEQVYELQDGTGLYAEIGKEEPPLCSKDGQIVGDGEYTIKGEDGKDYAVLTIKNGFVTESKYVAAPQYDDPSAPGFVAPAEGVTRIPMAEGLPFDFTPEAEDQNKGIVLFADGSKVKAGTYSTAQGVEIAVQPGGKASIKQKEEDLT